MEKVIYALWCDEVTTGDALRDALLDTTVPALLAAGALRVQLNVADSAVARAADLRQTTGVGPVAAFVGTWLDTANDVPRAPLDRLVGGTPGVRRAAAYLVVESVPLRDDAHDPDPDGRGWGFTQVVLLRRPSRHDTTAWHDLWQGRHTAVALETQSTVGYVQNTVVRALTPGAPAVDAIVEETFPPDAMDDPQVFFDAPGDPERLGRNLTRMVDSVSSFLDLDNLDVVPTSEYRGPARGEATDAGAVSRAAPPTGR